MRTLLLLPCLLLAASCSTTETRQAADAAATTDTAATRLEPMDTARAGSADVLADTLKTVRRLHVFSNPAAPDEFRLTLRGQNVLGGEVAFTITDAGGQVIFREMLSAADLEASMAYEMKTATAAPAEREAFIRRRLDEFFAEKNFRRPALAAKETYQAGPTDRATWEDLQKRPDAVAFVYLVGKEDRRRIAYSPRSKQVVKLPGLGS